jgi:hypothetical protein
MFVMTKRYIQRENLCFTLNFHNLLAYQVKAIPFSLVLFLSKMQPITAYPVFERLPCYHFSSARDLVSSFASPPFW